MLPHFVQSATVDIKFTFSLIRQFLRKCHFSKPNTNLALRSKLIGLCRGLKILYVSKGEITDGRSPNSLFRLYTDSAYKGFCKFPKVVPTLEAWWGFSPTPLNKLGKSSFPNLPKGLATLWTPSQADTLPRSRYV